MKYLMNRIIRNSLQAACLSVLLAAAGCEGGEPSAVTGPVEVNLFTKADANMQGTDCRLLAFNAGGDCVKNETFVPGSGKVSLSQAGKYRFALLSVPDGLDLPVAGTTEGLTSSFPLAFKAGSKVQAFWLSPATEEVETNATPTYTATLMPATAVLSLRVTGMPSGKEATFRLSNMCASVNLDGSLSDMVTPYSLAMNGETVCLPSKGNIILSYTIEGLGFTRTLDFDTSLTAGSRLSVNLAWKDEVKTFIVLSTTVIDWTPGNGAGEEGSAE